MEPDGLNLGGHWWRGGGGGWYGWIGWECQGVINYSYRALLVISINSVPLSVNSTSVHCLCSYNDSCSG